MTIEIPTPSPELLTQFEFISIETDKLEVAAIARLRETFAPYAKHNGFIQTGEFNDGDGANFTIEREAYIMNGRAKLRGLRCFDGFRRNHSDQNRGSSFGTRLYLTERGEWIEIRRVGHWSAWQREPTYWFCGSEALGKVLEDGEDPDDHGDVRTMTDQQVADHYNLQEVLRELSASMTELTKKLPARYGKLQQRSEIASRILTAPMEAK